jgi:hypothetical protein
MLFSCPRIFSTACPEGVAESDATSDAWTRRKARN